MKLLWHYIQVADIEERFQVSWATTTGYQNVYYAIEKLFRICCCSKTQL